MISQKKDVHLKWRQFPAAHPRQCPPPAHCCQWSTGRASRRTVGRYSSPAHRQRPPPLWRASSRHIPKLRKIPSRKILHRLRRNSHPPDVSESANLDFLHCSKVHTAKHVVKGDAVAVSGICPYHTKMKQTAVFSIQLALPQHLLLQLLWLV